MWDTGVHLHIFCAVATCSAKTSTLRMHTLLNSHAEKYGCTQDSPLLENNDHKFEEPLIVSFKCVSCLHAHDFSVACSFLELQTPVRRRTRSGPSVGSVPSWLVPVWPQGSTGCYDDLSGSDGLDGLEDVESWTLFFFRPKKVGKFQNYEW